MSAGHDRVCVHISDERMSVTAREDIAFIHLVSISSSDISTLEMKSTGDTKKGTPQILCQFLLSNSNEKFLSEHLSCFTAQVKKMYHNHPVKISTSQRGNNPPSLRTKIEGLPNLKLCLAFYFFFY